MISPETRSLIGLVALMLLVAPFLEHEVSATKAHRGILERRRQELAADDAQLAQEISLEQGRWTAINDQLEQLERSLAQQEPKR